jgi:hypothetical protein
VSLTWRVLNIGLDQLPAESRPVLSGDDERLDHLSLHEVAVELVQLRQPEVVTVEVIVRRVSAFLLRVTDVLRVDERAAELLPS